MERDNRKSHLAPQLSPSTQDLLRSTDSPHPLETPTSGDIPIGRAGIPTPREHLDYARTPSAAAAGNTFNLPVRSAPARNGTGTPEEGSRRQRYGVAPGYGYYPSN